jgi:hypothetical protein
MRTAREWGLPGDQVHKAHQRYLQALVDAALADAVASPAERRDLDAVCELLGLCRRP